MDEETIRELIGSLKQRLVASAQAERSPGDNQTKGFRRGEQHAYTQVIEDLREMLRNEERCGV